MTGAMNTGLIDRSTEAAASLAKPSTGQTPSTAKAPSAAKIWLKAIELTSRIESNPQLLFADIVEAWADKQGDRPALVSDTATLSYRAFAARMNHYARWALAAGIKPGET